MHPSEQGADPSDTRYRLVPRTLVFVLDGSQVLLIRGAPDKRLWADKLNGVGGHVERGESVFSAARRELLEETGLQIVDLELRGIVTIDAEPQLGVGLYVFTARALNRQVNPSREGALLWIDVATLPVEEVVDDVPILLERILGDPSAPPFCAHYSFLQDDNLVITFDS